MGAQASIDEFPIAELPATPQWSENYAIMWGDIKARISIFYSIGRNLADKSIWRELLGVALPDGRILFAKGYGRGATLTGPGSALTKLDVVEVGNKLRLTFAGPVTESSTAELMEPGYREGPKKHAVIALEFSARTAIWNMKGDSVEAGTIAGSMHYEQIGFADGAVELDGERFIFSKGYSIRDHSRGVRDVSEYRMHAWINGIFPGGRSFALYVMQMQGATEFGMTNAVIFEGDRQYPATIESTDLAIDTDDAQRRHNFVLSSELGRMPISVSEIIKSLPTSMVLPFDMCPGKLHHGKSAFMLDQLVIFDWNGEKGVGWTERGLARQRLA